MFSILLSNKTNSYYEYLNRILTWKLFFKKLKSRLYDAVECFRFFYYLYLRIYMLLYFDTFPRNRQTSYSPPHYKLESSLRLVAVFKTINLHIASFFFFSGTLFRSTWASHLDFIRYPNCGWLRLVHLINGPCLSNQNEFGDNSVFLGPGNSALFISTFQLWNTLYTYWWNLQVSRRFFPVWRGEGRVAVAGWRYRQ